MKYYIYIFLLFTQVVKAQDTIIKGNRISNKQTSVYFLKYYYEEDPSKILSKRAIVRSVNKDGSFCIIDYDIKDTIKVNFKSCFDEIGIPTYYGNDKEITRIFKDSIIINFKGRDTTILINTKRDLKNSTNLWFWKHRPRINEIVIVGGIRKNFVTNTIDIINTSYVYKGKERIKILNKFKTCFMVRVSPINGSVGIYDDRWYDKKGMLVKELHVVGNDGIRVGELSNLMKQQ